MIEPVFCVITRVVCVDVLDRIWQYQKKNKEPVYHVSYLLLS